VLHQWGRKEESSSYQITNRLSRDTKKKKKEKKQNNTADDDG
jgi:hypothetical protein